MILWAMMALWTNSVAENSYDQTENTMIPSASFPHERRINALKRFPTFAGAAADHGKGPLPIMYSQLNEVS
jgi:hypothetical protein